MQIALLNVSRPVAVDDDTNDAAFWQVASEWNDCIETNPFHITTTRTKLVITHQLSC